MANVNNAHGLRPLMRSMTGGPSSGTMGAHKLVGDATALYIYDVVKKASGGLKNTPCVTAGTAAAASLGVNLIYGVASKATDHIIIPAVLQVFEAQIDTIPVGDLNYNANLVAGAGSTTTLVSGHTLNAVATTNTLDFHVLGLWNSSDNAVGTFARVEVIFNNQQYSNQVAGV